MQTIIFLTKSGPAVLNAEAKIHPEDIKRGLMWRRKPLEENTGVIFDMGVSDNHGFWMKNTFIPLDMIFIDNKFTVVGVIPNVKPLTTESRHVGKKSRYVVEVNAGWSRKNGVTVGTKVEAPMHKTAKLEHKPEPTRDSPEGKELLRIRRASPFYYKPKYYERRDRAKLRESKTVDPKKHVRIRVRDNKGRVLQHHFISANKWGYPAGRVEEGETLQNAAARELLERTGFKINPKHLSSAGTDSKGFSLFDATADKLKRVAKPGEIGGYKTRIKWEAIKDGKGGHYISNVKPHPSYSRKKSMSKTDSTERSNVARHTRKLPSGKRVEVKPHTRKRSGNLEDRYPEIKFKRNVSRINKALAIKAKRGYSTPNESLHIKYGPKVHFGIGRHGAHFGVYGKGPTEHFYSDRVHVGGAKKGTTYQLTPGQKKRVKGLMKKRNSLRFKKTAVLRVASDRKIISRKEMAKIAAGFTTTFLNYLKASRPKSTAIERALKHSERMDDIGDTTVVNFLTKDRSLLGIPGTKKMRVIPKESSEKAAKLLVENPLAGLTFLAPGGSVPAATIAGGGEWLKRLLRSRTEKILAKQGKEKIGGVLTAQGRDRIKKKNFALKGGRYPIHDLAHARNALARVSQYGTPEEKSIVKSKVYAKYPGMRNRASK